MFLEEKNGERKKPRVNLGPKFPLDYSLFFKFYSKSTLFTLSSLLPIYLSSKHSLLTFPIYKKML